MLIFGSVLFAAGHRQPNRIVAAAFTTLSAKNHAPQHYCHYERRHHPTGVWTKWNTSSKVVTLFGGRLPPPPTWPPPLSYLRCCLHTTTTICSNRKEKGQDRKRPWNFWNDDVGGNMIYYCAGLVFIMIGLSFDFIPFFKMLCEQSSFAGLSQVQTSLERIMSMEKLEDRLIRVQFSADVPSSMQWKFKPLQDEIYLCPGETALVFYTATNPTKKPIVGISTYNLTPFQSAYYFNKIQCFCFDEQILNPGEEVDLPVFFYLDPDIVNDPLLDGLSEILLSYTFFESGSIKNLPSPFDPNFRPKSFPKQKEENPAKKAIQEALRENMAQ